MNAYIISFWAESQMSVCEVNVHYNISESPLLDIYGATVAAAAGNFHVKRKTNAMKNPSGSRLIFSIQMHNNVCKFSHLQRAWFCTQAHSHTQKMENQAKKFCVRIINENVFESVCVFKIKVSNSVAFLVYYYSCNVCVCDPCQCLRDTQTRKSNRERV